MFLTIGIEISNASSDTILVSKHADLILLECIRQVADIANYADHEAETPRKHEIRIRKKLSAKEKRVITPCFPHHIPHQEKILNEIRHRQHHQECDRMIVGKPKLRHQMILAQDEIRVGGELWNLYQIFFFL